MVQSAANIVSVGVHQFFASSWAGRQPVDPRVFVGTGACIPLDLPWSRPEKDHNLTVFEKSNQIGCRARSWVPSSKWAS